MYETIKHLNIFSLVKFDKRPSTSTYIPHNICISTLHKKKLSDVWQIFCQCGILSVDVGIWVVIQLEQLIQ